MSRREKAMALFEQGYNCSQAVAGAFCDKTNIDFDTMMRLASVFGGGMGRLREVCGAVSGMFIITGLLYGYDSAEDIEAKKNLYSQVQTLANSFKMKNGSYVCRELLSLPNTGADSPVPEARTAQYYKKRPCKELVGDAADILDKFLKEQNNGSN
ncbi:MAG: C_GCAxxG_C_C family protein [Clostridia bacterium]|nr:C_GCAxxG_C_C family protein [Clostridia bacterium]